MKSSFYWPQTHTNVMCEVLDKMKEGTEVIYVTGNHDEFLRRYSSLDFGNLRLIDETVHHTADGRQLLVLHGDQFDVVTIHHQWVAKLGDIAYSILLGLGRILNWFRERFGFGYWSLAAWAKGKVKKAVNHVSNFESLVAKECKMNQFDGVVCGHIHKAEVTRIGDVEYFNCGDWVDSCTALLEDESGKIFLHTDPNPPTKPERVNKKQMRKENEAMRERLRSSQP